MDLESDVSSFEESSDHDEPIQAHRNPAHAQQEEQIKDQHYDEVFSISDAEGDQSVSSGAEYQEEPNKMRFEPQALNSLDNYGKNQVPASMQVGGQGDGGFAQSDSDEEPADIIQGGYNPADYEGLQVSAEIKELFQYIQRYRPTQVPLETRIRPFIPEFIPAVGEVDAFLKIPRPDGQEEPLGLQVLDEPALNQSDPATLEIRLLPFIKRPGGDTTVAVRSIENADKNPKQITRWITSISDVLRNKPPPTVSFSRKMPEIDDLLDVWPMELEEMFKHIRIPGPDIELDLRTYAVLACNLLDIPVHNPNDTKSLTESLYLLFSLYSSFKENQHFRGGYTGQDQDYMQFAQQN